MISIIIPTLNEAKHIEACLESIQKQNEQYEIIVVDGGSTDGTTDIVLKNKRVHAIGAEKGRSHQMNAGARAANGNILLFVHADAILPAEALTSVLKKMEKGFVGGGFYQRFDDSRFSLKLVSFRSNMRAKLTRVFFGDQAIFIRKQTFFSMGGFKDLPIMEDLEFTKRMKKQGRIALIQKKITISARNYLEKGVLRLTWIYFILMSMYHVGFSFERINEKYKKMVL